MPTTLFSQRIVASDANVNPRLIMFQYISHNCLTRAKLQCFLNIYKYFHHQFGVVQNFEYFCNGNHERIHPFFMTANDSKAHLPGVDFVKYIMAFAVVAIHFGACEGKDFSYPKILQWFNAAAVPFFFLCSGFLLQRKLAAIDSSALRRTMILKRVRKLFRLWVSWLILCLPMTIYALRNDTLISALKAYVYQLAIYGWEFHAAPLWFLYSMMWVFLAIALCQGFRKYKTALLGLFLTIGFSNWLSAHSTLPLLPQLKTLTANTLGGYSDTGRDVSL